MTNKVQRPVNSISEVIFTFCSITHEDMETCGGGGGDGGVVPPLLNSVLDKLSFRLHAPADLLSVKIPRHPLDRRLGHNIIQNQRERKYIKNKQTPWPLVRERTIPTERPPLVDEI
jgi:hypothetical protein